MSTYVCMFISPYDLTVEEKSSRKNSEASDEETNEEELSETTSANVLSDQSNMTDKPVADFKEIDAKSCNASET